MSARVLNPVMMAELSCNLGSGRMAPSRAALARVRRDLFGPVDHADARALAERELRAQSLQDAERWGFDFQLETPKRESRFVWEPVSPRDVVPEPYALRGMPYLRKHAPGTPRKASGGASPRIARAESDDGEVVRKARKEMVKEERTPPQEPRVPEIGARSGESTPEDAAVTELEIRKKFDLEDPSTPVLPPGARKQSTITDYMKSRKRMLNGSTKSMAEPPEKIARNAGQIRS